MRGSRDGDAFFRRQGQPPSPRTGWSSAWFGEVCRVHSLGSRLATACSPRGVLKAAPSRRRCDLLPISPPPSRLVRVNSVPSS